MSHNFLECANWKAFPQLIPYGLFGLARAGVRNLSQKFHVDFFLVKCQIMEISKSWDKSVTFLKIKKKL